MSQQASAPILKGAWSDAEKLALLVSMIKSSGAPPKWSNGIAVPEGRTLQASAKMYSEIFKASASVKMTKGDAVTPSGKRPRVAQASGGGNSDSNDDIGGTAPTKKRKTVASKSTNGRKRENAKAKGKGSKKPNLAEAIDEENDEQIRAEDSNEEDKKALIKTEVEEMDEEEIEDAV